MNQLIIDFNSLSLSEKLDIIQESILSNTKPMDRMNHIQDLVLCAKGIESQLYFQD